MKNVIIYVVCPSYKSFRLAQGIYAHYGWARVILLDNQYHSNLLEGIMFKTLLMKLYNEWKHVDYVGMMPYSLFSNVDKDIILNIIESSNPAATDAVFFHCGKIIEYQTTVDEIVAHCISSIGIFIQPPIVNANTKLKFINNIRTAPGKVEAVNLASRNIEDTLHSLSSSFMTTPSHMISYIKFFVNAWLPSIESHHLINTDANYDRLEWYIDDGTTSEVRGSKKHFSQHSFVNNRILLHYFKCAGLSITTHSPTPDEINSAVIQARTLEYPIDNSYTKDKRFIKKPKDCKTLVLYACHEHNNRVDEFINKCIFYDDNIDFLMISNSFNSTFNVPKHVKILNRENIGFDFGAWSYGLLHNDTYKNYDYFIFINSSVIGPYVPMYYSGNWTDIFIEGLTDDIKLFGCTINCNVRCNNGVPHVQSYCFSVNKETVNFLIKEDLFSMSNHALTVSEAILLKEIRMSSLIINNGWNIGCLMKYYRGIDFRLPPNQRGCDILGDMAYDNSFKTNFFKGFEEIVFIKGNRYIDFERETQINTTFKGL